ncbi:MAG: Uncharacterised protein [SAR116 cluster bacterium]|nr:MAG: Uncharacterised protein [SAR116 cluster bacterium]
MHPDQPFRCLERCGYILERNRRRVGSHDCIRLHPRFRSCKNTAFDIEILGHCLNQQIGLGQTGTIWIGLQTRHHRLDLASILQTAFIQTARQRHCAGNRIFRQVLKRDVKPAHGGNSSDVAAHHTCANNMNMRHRCFAARSFLHRIIQLKAAPQTNRCRRHHQLRKQ